MEFKKTFGFILQMEGAPDGRTCYFCLEASDHPVELWRIRIDTGSAERVFTFNPHTDALTLGKRGSLWEKREAYIENSPLFYLNHVRTPVLIVTGGDQEWEEDKAQAKQAFSALRWLKQRVELRIYHEEGHTFRSLKNRRDLWNRIFEWFDTYLKSPKEG